MKDVDYADNTAGLGSGCIVFSVKAAKLLVYLRTLQFVSWLFKKKKKKARPLVGYKLDGRDQIQDSKFTMNLSGKKRVQLQDPFLF